MSGHFVADPNVVIAPGALVDVNLIQYLGVAVSPANPVDVQDTGLNTNPERWLNDNHWDNGIEIVLVAAAAVNLGAAVGAGVIRRIREISVRNAGQVNTVITLSDAGGNRLSFDVPSQTTRTWSSQDGREFAAASQPQIASSAAAAAPAQTFITASGVEA